MSDPKSIQALKRLISRAPSSEELRDKRAKLFSEKNDWTLAMTAASLLESTLEIAIEKNFRPLNASERRDLFDGTSPLTTFSAKIKMTYALDIIGRMTRDDMDCIRDIRNAFAHTRVDLSFDQEYVVRVCNKIKLPDNLNLPKEIKFNNQSQPRIRYLLTTNCFTLTLDDLNSHGQSDFAGQLRF
jgi:DNA-binding MltR family transcriptional regulator